MGEPQMIVLDTHVLVWWVNGEGLLSRKATQVIEESIKNSNVLVSSISIWEICLLVKKERLRLSMDLHTWISKIENIPFISFIPVDNTIARTSVFLPHLKHEDPADRIIIATALTRGATLVSADKRILGYKKVRSLW